MTNSIQQKYLEYVCSNCFCSLDKCICRHKPTMLIHVDRNLHDCIRILNEKGYMTRSCCEGHYGGSTEIYILFVSEHRFSSLPEGFKCNKLQNRISYDVNIKEPVEQYVAAKEEAIRNLLEWCKSLCHVRELYR